MPPEPLALDLRQLAAAYRAGELRPTRVAEAYLDRIRPGPVYRSVTDERAREQARRAERRFQAGIDLGPLQGIPIAIKDLLDMRGEISASGSRLLLEEGSPAAEDAPVVARLDAAGAVFLGRTNMTELAFSGVGLNPHFGTPGNAHDPERVPGGSSSGSAVAVATGLACAAIGSDTGGSVRIPAAYNGLVGLKTSDGALPTDGAVPLSTTLDTLGPITRTVEDAWEVYRAMRGEASVPLPPAPERLVLWAPPTVLHDELDPAVADGFATACAAWERAGAEVRRDPLPALEELGGLYRRFGSLPGHEALTLYGERLEREGARVDPRVARRILALRERPATDYIALGYARRRLRSQVWEAARDVDALLAPTVAIEPPLIEELEADESAFFRANALILRNTTLFNLLSGPAATVPIATSPAGLPIGGMIATAPGGDGAALAIAARWRDALA